MKNKILTAFLSLLFILLSGASFLSCDNIRKRNTNDFYIQHSLTDSTRDQLVYSFHFPTEESEPVAYWLMLINGQRVVKVNSNGGQIDLSKYINQPGTIYVTYRACSFDGGIIPFGSGRGAFSVGTEKQHLNK